jgi:hypothetical protein
MHSKEVEGLGDIFFVTAGGKDQDAVSIKNSGEYEPIHSQWKDSGESTMVYYFTSNEVTPAAFIYVGKDKVESMSLDPFV